MWLVVCGTLLTTTNFGHFNIIKYCKRDLFKSVHGMNVIMTERWNSLVKPEDTVFHLGDLCFHNKIDPKELVKKLNGRIVLIKGNHDRKKTLDAVYEWHKNFNMKIGKYKVCLNHRPIYPPGTPDPFNDHDKSITNPNQYDFFITGHIHEKRDWTGKSLNVGVDRHNFYPLSIDQVEELLKQREKELENEGPTSK